MSDVVTELPTVPSELITIALEDLELAEARPGVRVNMSDWRHMVYEINGERCRSDRPHAIRTCEVCLAGAVMIGRLGESINQFGYPPGLGLMVENQLAALDELRDGGVGCFLDMLNMSPPNVPIEILKMPVTLYKKDSKKFKSDLRDIAHALHTQLGL